MVAIRIEDVLRDFAGYLRQVEAGEVLLIMRDDQPVAELRPVTEHPHDPRPFGLCAGEFVVPDDFDDPLPEDVLAQFEGS